MPQDSQPQLMVILVGAPGSGKSTLSTQWCDNFQGKSVIIDRCNFDKGQRKVWIEIASKYNVPIDCLELSVPFQVLQQRVMNRKDHPGGVQGKRGVEILTMFAKTTQPCHTREGLNRVITFPNVFKGPVFDTKAWSWLSKAFSVPIKFAASNQECFSVDASQAINSNSKTTSSSANHEKNLPFTRFGLSLSQNKPSDNLQNRFEALLLADLTTSESTPNPSQSTEINDV